MAGREWPLGQDWQPRSQRDEFDRYERRRFLTRLHVEEAAACGGVLRLGPRDVLTDEAARRVEALGVRVEREGAAPPARPSTGATPIAGPGTVGGGSGGGGSAGAGAAGGVPAGTPGVIAPAELRRAVRAALVAELGHEPPNLDAVIDRVMNPR